jgi:hypothetical protein
MNLNILKTIILASLVAASPLVKAADAAKKKPVAKTEQKKPNAAVTAPTDSTTTYTDLLPSADSQNPAVTDQPSVEAEEKKIKDSRWVDQKQLLPRTNEAPKTKEESRVKLTANCIDKTGRSFSAGEAGYDACLMEARDSRRNHGDKNTTKDPNDASSVGTGFKIKFP